MSLTNEEARELAGLTDQVIVKSKKLLDAEQALAAAKQQLDTFMHDQVKVPQQ